MPAATSRPRQSIRRITEISLATSTKPIRRSTHRMVTAPGVAGEDG
jgi:hypothetical protein